MKALTLTQPWAGLVASGIKRVENRPRAMGAHKMLGERVALHASRQIDNKVYERIAELAPELLTIAQNIDGYRDHFYVDTNRWHTLSQITSAVIAVGTIAGVIECDGPLFARPAQGDPFHLGDQERWFFGPVGILLRDDIIALPEPVPCKGMLGFWSLPPEVEAQVVEQLRLAA